MLASIYMVNNVAVCSKRILCTREDIQEYSQLDNTQMPRFAIPSHPSGREINPPNSKENFTLGIHPTKLQMHMSHLSRWLLILLLWCKIKTTPSGASFTVLRSCNPQYTAKFFNHHHHHHHHYQHHYHSFWLIGSTWHLSEAHVRLGRLRNPTTRTHFCTDCAAVLLTFSPILLDTIFHSYIFI